MRSATVVPAACSLEPDSVAQTVVHGAESAERRLEALTAWDASSPHHLWKDNYGDLFAAKAIFDSED